MKALVWIIGLLLCVPAFRIIKERYGFLTSFKQKAIAWLICIGSGVVGLIVYWTIMALIQSDSYEWLISDICFIGFIYLYSYILTKYSATATRSALDSILKDVEKMVNQNRGVDKMVCQACLRKQEKVHLKWDYTKAGSVSTEEELTNAIIVDGSCCKEDEAYIKHTVLNMIGIYMANNKLL